MAEQEACANAVTEALGCAEAELERGEGDARGESLLLPLLQGLLGGGDARLAAGLGAAPPDVAADVRRALARLRRALQPPTAHPHAAALLALAARLEDALAAADRLDGVRRKPRRRSRTARHTVGVTRGELDQARRLVDELPLPDAAGLSSAASTSSRGTEPDTPEREPSVGELSYHAPVEVRNKPVPIAHSVSYDGERSEPTRHEVVERRAPAPRRSDFFRHSVADAPPAPPVTRPVEAPRSSIAAIANKFDASAQNERPQQATAPRRAPVVSPSRRSSRDEPSRTFFQPLPPTYNFAAPPSTQDDSKPLPRDRASRKLRMKRANTIDIGRPLAALHKLDSDTDDDGRKPYVPEFRPQTENDKKFVAFMRKNESMERENHPQANWSSRFGNIKHAFESRERQPEEESPRRACSASSSARRFWRAAEEAGPAAPRSRSFFADSRPEAIKPPWVTERRAPAPHPAPASVPKPPRLRPVQPPAPSVPAAAPVSARVGPALAPLPIQAPAPTPLGPPPVPHSPTRPIVVKPFAARPIPVNQFSHAPMSAFKPPSKVTSPTSVPLVWSPPSTTAVSPAGERAPPFPTSPPRPSRDPSPPPAAWQPPVPRSPVPPERQYEPRALNYEKPPPPTHAQPPATNFPIRGIPSQNGLAAPELVRRVNEEAETPSVDAQKLQIEFYERQIREKRRREAQRAAQQETERKPPAPPAYTVTDYTPPGGTSMFVPLQHTPDIEKARAHKVDYLPDVVTNEAERGNSPAALRSPAVPVSPATRSPAPARSPRPADLPPAYRNGEALTNGHGPTGPSPDETTEHEVAVTRVMRGPVRGAATVTAGARTRVEREAADALRGALDKVSLPRTTADRRKPMTRPLGRSPPSLGASRESVMSSESAASAGSGLSRSGSWHQLAGSASSPRRAVRTKSMHLLAVPKLFEGGIAREEILDKKRAVEAYFKGGANNARGPAPAARSRPAGYGLGRSRTVATLAELHLLDESNADDAFEDLVSALA